MRGRRVVRQQHFAAWRRQTDQERYSALETVHNMSLQRLLNQNKELAVDVSFDPIVAPCAKKALLNYRDTMTLYEEIALPEPEPYSDASSDDHESSPTLKSMPLRSKPTSDTSSRISHRSTARVLHTQLATAQLARIFQTIVQSRDPHTRAVGGGLGQKGVGARTPRAEPINISSRPNV
jgi:hypothetical protein